MARSTSSDVLIIGGGVIGAACAYALARAGRQVTVIDRGPMGHGASYGNAGWIVPCHATTLPAPGALRQASKWLLRPDSPLYIQPRPSWELIHWLVRFLRYSNARHQAFGAPLLIDFARKSQQLMDAFAAEHGAESMGYEKRGFLYVCATQTGLDHAAAETQRSRDMGIPSRVLGADELRSLQPAVTGPITGGVHAEGEAQAEPLKVVEALIDQARAAGATILPHTEVFAFEAQGQRIRAVHTTRGTLTAQHHVLAAGAWSPGLVRELKLHVPIQAGKGYALIVDRFDPAPTMPLLLLEKKVAVTPRDNSVRLAGTMEIAGMNERITPRRVAAIARGARAFLSLPEDLQVRETWRGLRPCTPDGLPMIGPAQPWENLTLATGHAMLGLTLAFATGQLVTDMLTGRKPLVDPAPYAPARFA